MKLLAGWRPAAPEVVVGTGGPPAAGTGLSPGGTSLTWRTLSALAGMFVITWSFRLCGYLTDRTWLAVPVVVLGLAGLLIITASWLPAEVLPPGRQRLISWGGLLAVLTGLALWSFFQVFTAPDYATDEIAFDQYAAQLVLHGINPYLHSMAPAFPLFHVSPNGWTFRLNGQPVTSLSYPALSFLVYLPLLALGMTAQAAVWVNVAAWAAGSLVLFAVLPRRMAPLATVVASANIFDSYVAGGVTDALFIPLLTGAAVGWDRFARTRERSAWLGPALMGLALAVKQTPWLVLPFVVAGIVIESRQAGGWGRAARTGLRYAGITLAAFLCPNLPFLLDAPGAWLKGILTPLLSPLVPAGQGLIGLSLALPAGGGSLLAYNIAAACVLLTCLACYVTSYRVLKPAAFLLPAIALFFAARSLGSYLVMLIPPALAAAVTTAPPPGAARWRHWKLVALTGAAAGGAAIGVALGSASPMSVSIRGVHTTGELATVQQLTVEVVNNTGRSLTPAFTIQNGTTITGFWHRRQGPAVLRPHHSARYTIVAPSYAAMPSIASGFQVLAFDQHPASVSRSNAYLANTWHLVLRPAAVDQPVAVGHQITVQAQIVSELDEPVRVARVPVYLGQVIYGQNGLVFSQAVINHRLPGATPVEALTDPAGAATFTIHSPVAGQDPIYFEANLVKAGSFYPYGYSPVLAVRFRP